MTKMKILLIISCLVVAAIAQILPCTSPPQWESRELRLERDYTEFRKLSYDETNKRERSVAEIQEGSSREFYDNLLLYNENKNYSINMRTRECRVTPINRPFRNRGVRPDARWNGFFELGATGVLGESAEIASYAANETTEMYVALVTYPSCYPVQHLHFTQMYGFEQSDYYDLKIGIVDENVFIPPSECMMVKPIV